MPKKYIIGNWKMNQSQNTIHEFFSTLNITESSKNVNAWVAPQFVHLPYSIDLADNVAIKIGAQNCSDHEKGAFTGEVSASALVDVETHFVILGHSERRQYFGETSQTINTKVRIALNNKLVVVLCVGETLEQREAGKTSETVLGQLNESLTGVVIDSVDQLVIAYEPVWAIGTGKTATPDQAEEVHAEIREALQKFNSSLGTDMSILYGGSVKPSNIGELIGKPNINGGLVGGASLNAQDFNQLVDGANL